MKFPSLSRHHLFVLAAVAVPLVWGVLLPAGALIGGSLESATGWSTAVYVAALREPNLWEAAANSIGLSLATVAGCALIGIPLALLVSIYDFPGRRIVAALANLPLVLPPLVGVLAFLFLFDESGFATRLVMKVFGLHAPPWSLRGRAAIVAVHTYSMYVYFYSFTSSGLAKLDFSLVEAARSLGAGPLTAWRRVVFPLLLPSLTGAALLTFMTSMASFSAPYLFGGGVRYLTIEIFNAYANREVPLAQAESVLLILISLPALVFVQRFEGTRRFVGVSKGSVARRPMTSVAAKAATLAVGVLLLVFLLLPPAMLVLLAFAADGSWMKTLLPTAYTVDHFRAIFSDDNGFTPIVNSFAMALPAAAAAGLVGIFVAYLATRMRFRGKRLMTGLVLVPWILPGTVVAVAVVAAYRAPHWYTGNQVLVGTFWILPAIYFLRVWPLATRSIQGNFEQLDVSQEEAARTLGAGWITTLRAVVVPQIWPGLVNGTTLAFVTLLGEFAASVLAFVYRNRPISVEIATQLRVANLGRAAAYGVLLMAVMATALVLGELAKLKWARR